MVEMPVNERLKNKLTFQFVLSILYYITKSEENKLLHAFQQKQNSGEIRNLVFLAHLRIVLPFTEERTIDT